MQGINSQRRQRWAAYLGLGLLCAALLGGCSNDTGDGASGEPIVGSNTIDESITQAMFVESVHVDMPFSAIIYNGEPAEVRLSGEDNLLALIEVTEVEVGEWTIVAPQDLNFEQNERIEIYIPFIEMVEISISGDDIELGDDPFEVARDSD